MFLSCRNFDFGICPHRRLFPISEDFFTCTSVSPFLVIEYQTEVMNSRVIIYEFKVQDLCSHTKFDKILSKTLTLPHLSNIIKMLCAKTAGHPAVLLRLECKDVIITAL